VRECTHTCPRSEPGWRLTCDVANVPAMRPRVNLVSRRYVDLRRVASQMCRDTDVRLRGCR